MVEAVRSTRLKGRAADLSLGGCYLDAINQFPVGASVRLRLTREAHSFECEARVTYSCQAWEWALPSPKSRRIKPRYFASWIAELSGELGATASSCYPNIRIRVRS